MLQTILQRNGPRYFVKNKNSDFVLFMFMRVGQLCLVSYGVNRVRKGRAS